MENTKQTLSASLVSKKIASANNINQVNLMNFFKDVQRENQYITKYSSGMKVKFEIIRNNHIDAYAGISKKNELTIAISEGAINKLDPECVRGIMAHEMGHLIQKHLDKLDSLWGAIKISSLLIIIISYIIFKFSLPFLLITIGTNIFALIVFGARRQKYELEADLFALHGTDRETLIRLLRIMDKDEEENVSIYFKFKKLIGSHPSIKKRIEHLESYE